MERHFLNFREVAVSMFRGHRINWFFVNLYLRIRRPKRAYVPSRSIVKPFRGDLLSRLRNLPQMFGLFGIRYSAAGSSFESNLKPSKIKPVVLISLQFRGLADLLRQSSQAASVNGVSGALACFPFSVVPLPFPFSAPGIASLRLERCVQVTHQTRNRSLRGLLCFRPPTLRRAF
jgi:hypothetical protein